ncbi:MAG: hypothetical protein MZV70_71475 [Desulfobacterales bacterium]|nr:hypothetical protein [Desulfobacterales bacterium]
MRPEPHPADMPTFRVDAGRVKEVLRHLKHEAAPRFKRLEDLTAVDESARRDRGGAPGLHPGLPPARLRPAHPACA